MGRVLICSSCGSEIVAGTRWCAKCHTPVGQAHEVFISTAGPGGGSGTPSSIPSRRRRNLVTSGMVTAIGIVLSIVFLPPIWMVFGIIGSFAAGRLVSAHRSFGL